MPTIIILALHVQEKMTYTYLFFIALLVSEFSGGGGAAAAKCFVAK